MKTPTLHYNKEDGTASIKTYPSFDKTDSILKIDIIADWITQLTELYHQSIDEFYHSNFSNNHDEQIIELIVARFIDTFGNDPNLMKEWITKKATEDFYNFNNTELLELASQSHITIEDIINQLKS